MTRREAACPPRGPERRPPWNRADLLCVAALAALCCLFFHRVLLSPGAMFYHPLSDFWRFLAPQVTFVVDSLYRDGELPLWEPFAYSGKPPYGVPQLGVFYPFFGVVLLTRSLGAYGVLFLVHSAIAAFGMYLFVREIAGDREQAFVSAVVFAFSGYLCARILVGQYWHYCSVAWIPCIFFCLERLMRRPGPASSALLGSACALQFLAGHPQYFLYTMLLLGAYLVWIASAGFGGREPLAAARVAASLALSGGIFVLLCGVQLLPALEFSGLAYRANMRSLQVASGLSLPPTQLLTLIFPTLMGSAVDASYWGAGNFWELCAYGGLVPLALAAASAALCRDRRNAFFLGLIVFSLLFAMGTATPLFPLMYRFVPGIRLFRCPPRMLALHAFAVAAAAGYGFSALRRGGAGARRVAWAAAAAFLLLLSAVGAFACFPGAAVGAGKALVRLVFDMDPAGPHTRSLAEWQALVPGYYAKLRGALIAPWQLANLAAAACVFALLRRRRPAPRLSYVALLAAVLADLWFFGLPMLAVRHPREVMARGPVTEFLAQQPGLFRIHEVGGGVPLEQSEPAGIAKIKGFESVFLDYYIDYLACLEYEGRRSLGACDFDYELRIYLDIERADLEASARSADNLNFLNLLNVRYVLTGAPLAHPAMELVHEWRPSLDYRDPLGRSCGPVFVYANRVCLPRAFVVRGAVVARDGYESLMLIKANDPRKTVVLDAPAGRMENPGGFQEAEVTAYAPNRVEVSVRLDDAGYLVLSEIWYPGWTATDERGFDLPILRVNRCLRGVYLEPGARTVVFRYEPRSIAVGGLMSLAGLAVVCLIVGSPLFRGGGRGRAETARQRLTETCVDQ